MCARAWAAGEGRRGLRRLRGGFPTADKGGGGGGGGKRMARRPEISAGMGSGMRHVRRIDGGVS